MRLKPPDRRRTTTAITRLKTSSPAQISNHNSGEMFSEYKSSAVINRIRTGALFFVTFFISYVIFDRAFDTCQIRLPEYLISSTDFLYSAVSFDSIAVSFHFKSVFRIILVLFISNYMLIVIYI